MRKRLLCKNRKYTVIIHNPAWEWMIILLIVCMRALCSVILLQHAKFLRIELSIMAYGFTYLCT